MEQKDYRLAAIMYTDIAGFSRMMEKDEAGTLELLRFHNQLIGEIVARHHGTVIKTIGDALLVDFRNTVEALQSALEIQDKLYAHNKSGGGLPLLVRIGLHLGDIYFFENDALGEGINIAARLQSLARPGCICFSQDVYNLVLNKIEFRAEKLGKVSLKNITKEIHAYEITTPNVEFDPEREKPRPGYKPGSYLGAEEEGGPRRPAEDPVGSISASEASPAGSSGPAWAGTRIGSPRAAAAEPPRAPRPPEPPRGAEAAGEGLGPDREYSPEGSKTILAEIRKAILQDIKTEGRRLGVEEALQRYGSYGVEAREVIASMAEQGLLIKRRKAPDVVIGGARLDSDFGRSIQDAVHGIVSEIERSVERSIEGSGTGRGRNLDRERDRADEMRERIRERIERRMARHGQGRGAGSEPEYSELETGKWDKELKDSAEWKPGAEEESRDFEAYRSSLRERARKQRGGFIGNLTSYLAVNGFLLFGNFALGWGHQPWAFIVALGWGIGLLSSAAAALRAGRKSREAEAMPELDREQLATYKKLNRVRDSIMQHGVSTLTVPALLAFINIYFSGPAFLWFLIPTAAMALSFLSHLLAYRITRPRLERELKKSLGIEGGWREVFKTARSDRAAASDLGPYAELYREAERAKSAILGQAKAADQADAELGPSLEGYLGQVRLLAQSANEIDRLVEAIPMAELDKDKAALLAKESSASSDSLKAEYRRGVEEIEKQEGSYEELKNQSELIRLRLGSSVNQLKQMRIDMARLRAAGEGGAEPGGMDRLRSRTDELSRYLEDFRKGYDESAKDPFAELEELARKEEEKKKRLEGPRS